MKNKFTVGVFVNKIKDKKEFATYKEFILSIINKNNEEIIKERNFIQNYSIETDKSIYYLYVANHAQRGRKLNKIYLDNFVYNEDIVRIIEYCLFPYYPNGFEQGCDSRWRKKDNFIRF